MLALLVVMTTRIQFGSIQIGNKLFSLVAHENLSKACGFVAVSSISAWLRDDGNASLYDGPSHTIVVWTSNEGFAVADSWHWTWSGSCVAGDLQ